MSIFEYIFDLYANSLGLGGDRESSEAPRAHSDTQNDKDRPGVPFEIFIGYKTFGPR